MLLLRSRIIKQCYFPLCRRFIATQSRKYQATEQLADIKHNDEYWDTPQYPKIKDTSYESRKEEQAHLWHKEIQSIPTIEEKLIKVNMPRYYGYKVVEMSDSRLPYNCLPAIQHYTRTLFEQEAAALKEDVTEDSEKIAYLIQSTKGSVIEALELAHDYMSYNFDDTEMESSERENLFRQTVVEQINRVLINTLHHDFPHLGEIETDFNPRHEAFWAVGGIDPPKNVVKSKEGREWQKEMAKNKTDRFMQYKCHPILALRHRQQLTPWKTETDYINMEFAKKVPHIRYDPRTLGFTTTHQHGTNIPGHWPGNMAGFGYISYQSRPKTSINDPEHQAEALRAHAIQSSFAWVLALANYNGFNTYSELTYPWNTQTILTDGKHWSFYKYQLNTLLMHGRHINENPRVNYCRGTAELKLYENVDNEGKIVGFNDNVLHHLISFYTKVPNVQRRAKELSPYLGPEIKCIADYQDKERRTFLEKVYKHMISNRPRHLELPETYIWEKIYKIDNKSRPMDARRRYFEVFVNPWKRTMDQHAKEYIPKVVRPEGPKSKKKFKTTYYP